VRLISCNTDLFHLAVAMGLPVTGVFSNQDVERWAPEDREGIDIFDYDSFRAWSPKQIGDLVRQRLTPAAQVNQ
jgi:hypothetical protein